MPIIADDGIRRHTVEPLIAAEADGVVLGSLLFDSGEPLAATMAWLRRHQRRTARSTR